MTGCVNQVEVVAHTVLGLVVDAHRLGLDRDPALPLQLHRVEELCLHLALGDRPGPLQQPVGQRGLPVVDMGDDAEVANTRGHRVFRCGSSRL